MKVTDTHVYFLKNEFSNFHKCTFTFFDFTFGNTEQAFMWQKAMTFRDLKIAQMILETSGDPMGVKHLGRMVKGYDDAIWSSVREQVMLDVNLAKYSQNEYLKTKLLDTDSRILVEASPSDRIWGVGLSENDPDILDEANWDGQNLLGHVLMAVRTALAAQL